MMSRKLVQMLFSSGLCVLAVFLLMFADKPASAYEPVNIVSVDKDQGALMEMDIEELRKIKVDSVISASRYKQKVTEAPSSVTIITADEIRKYGYRTLAEILKSVKGFFITYDRNYSYLGVRGLGRAGDYNNRFLVLVDGHRMNEAIQDQAFIGNEFILDMDLIDRVEVVPGPSSSLYGGNAFFGVINVISKKGSDMKGTELSGSAGSFDTYKGRISYGNRLNNNTEILVSGSAFDSKGHHDLYYPEFDFPASNNGVAVNNDYENNVNFFEKISFSDFTLEGGYISREKGIPTGSWNRVFNDPRNRTIDTRSFLELKYEHEFSGFAKMTARTYYDYFTFKGDYVYDGTSIPGYPPLYVNKDYFEGQWWGGEVMLTTKSIENHTITFGSEYKGNFKQDQTNYDQDPYNLNLGDHRTSRIWSAYLQDEYHLSKNLIINAGVRYDNYSTFGDTANPRAAVIYSPLEKTTFKFIYGTAFRAPNAFELYYNYPNSGLVANPDLKPERITTYELVFERYLGDHFRTSVSGFAYRLSDRIVLFTDPSDPDPTNPTIFSFQNLGIANAKGLELELAGKWAGGWEGRASYTAQKAEDGITGEILPNSPRRLAKLNVIAPLLKQQLFAGIEEQYMSMRKTIIGNEVGSFYITNLTLFDRGTLKNMEISASIYNLFDKTYFDPASSEHLMDEIEQDGRNYRVKITYLF